MAIVHLLHGKNVLISCHAVTRELGASPQAPDVWPSRIPAVMMCNARTSCTHLIHQPEKVIIYVLPQIFVTRPRCCAEVVVTQGLEGHCVHRLDVSHIAIADMRVEIRDKFRHVLPSTCWWHLE
jgi:hypothetical protein